MSACISVTVTADVCQSAKKKKEKNKLLIYSEALNHTRSTANASKEKRVAKYNVERKCERARKKNT